MTKEQAKEVLEIIAKGKDTLNKEDVYKVIDMIDDQSIMSIPYTPPSTPNLRPITVPSYPWDSPFYCNAGAGNGAKPV